jgi:hypothetical protein
MIINDDQIYSWNEPNSTESFINLCQPVLELQPPAPAARRHSGSFLGQFVQFFREEVSDEIQNAGGQLQDTVGAPAWLFCPVKPPVSSAG